MRLKAPVTAITSPSISSSRPNFRAAAVWLWMQYSQPFVTETAMAIISFINGSSRPGFMVSCRLYQTSFNKGGCDPIAFQILGTQSIFLRAMMSS